MAKIQDPILFSTHFKIDPNTLENAGLIDPFLNVDTQLFIDPILLEKSENDIIKTNAIKSFRNHFNNFIRLLKISKEKNDAAWKGAMRLLDLTEPPENGLGYGGSGRSGSSRPDRIRDAIMKTSKEIIELGSEDPEMISMMGFFEEEVGPDTISDFTTKVISNELADITESFCLENNINISNSAHFKKNKLPYILNQNGDRKYILLIPKDIVRDLPIANDWSDIEQAVFQNNIIREKVNSLLSSIAHATIADRKAALRRAVLESPKTLKEFIEIVKDNADFYDENIDALGYYQLKSILSKNLSEFKTSKSYDFSNDPEKLKEFVIETIQYFADHVENKNLWEELWIGNKPKKERASQLIYYAMADCYCKANDIDISPEANMGGGPIDFKFSKGYKARVLVEMKRSTGTVVHGYNKQLEIYKTASQTNYGIFVVINYGNLGQKLSTIRKIKAERENNGEISSEIIVIDARKKKSASKR